MNVLLNRHSGVFLISAGRKSDRATLGKQIKSRHGHLISKRQLLHDAVEPRSLIPFDFFCAIYPQNDFIAEPVVDTVRSQSKDERLVAAYRVPVARTPKVLFYGDGKEDTLAQR